MRPPQLDLTRLLQPRSVAVAGASPEPTSLGGAVLRNIAGSGFTGPLYLVSPTRTEINGVPCLKSLHDLPHGVDVAVLNVPHKAVREAIGACIERGVGGAVVFAAGFGEAGEEGRREQEEIAAMCRAGGLALLGPNCLGFVNYANGAALSFESLDFQPMAGPPHAAVVAQSGAMASNIRSALLARGARISHVVTTGNEAVVRIDHVIRHLVDEGVGLIAAYVEQIRDPAAFLAAARVAREAGRPILMVHPGASASGRAAALSHTGAMVSDYAAMKTAVEDEGVVLVETMDELFDAAAILYRFPEPTQGRVGVITNSGAVRGLSLDFCEKISLEVAALGRDTADTLRQLLPPQCEISNPLDVGTAGFSDASVFGKTTSAMLADPAVGSVLLAMAGGGPWQQRAKAEAIAPVALTASKPVTVAILGDESPLDPGCVAPLRETGTPLFRSPERALRAFRAVNGRAVAYARAAERTAPPPPAPALSRHGPLPEYEGKALLSAIGIPVPEGALVQDVEAAVAAASRITYPLVMKLQATWLTHKSEVGGVIIGVKDEAALRAGWQRLTDSADRARAGGAIDGILIEEMARPGLELVIGGRNDPDWGAFVVLGLGGVWVEALDAIEMLPAHAGRDQILERLRRMRGAKLLGAFRGQAPRDVEAVADAVMALGTLLRAHPEIKEVDVNPLTVFAEGEGVMALDALFIAD
ncbi:acetate--CoA ligase family protein [Nitrospirillum bahiense]|uniref:Acyl-CoA synthetase (NDP forming) n=1 Tax=Nitrospirillum amazonense TaxID=28077 RepID=A0A560FTT7_9PROT|nr:acetate--CoA ligase family protein [Nitrospirillum amazonense]TWB25046.1 acyl-CoA synthetase (NDP forming) [Nitrospirillum amazonense]